MGLFDGLKWALGGAQQRRPDGGYSGVRVDFSPWTIIGQDIARQYDFQGIAGPGTKTMFQIRCTVEQGIVGFLHHHVHFVLQPAVSLEKETFLVAFLGTMDENVETGFFPVRTAYLEGGGNLFWVTDKENASKVLSVLHAGKPMRFLVLNKQECLIKMPLENDLSYRSVFKEIQDRVSR